MKTPITSKPYKEAGFRMADYWVWDPSIVRDNDGLYHLFASRVPKGIPYHPGWLTDSEVIRAVSKTPEGPFEFAGVVLSRRGSEYWDGRSTFNPRVTQCGDTWLLYYTGSTHPLEDVVPGEPFPVGDPRCIVARSNKRIGVATAKSLDGQWTRQAAPVLPATPGSFHSFLTSNAAPILHEDGSAYLMFKSRRHIGNTHSQMFIGVARARHYLGPYEVEREPIFDATSGNEIEDPFVWMEAGQYWMIAKDMTGIHCGERYAPLIVSSPDGIHWNLNEAQKFFSRDITWSDDSHQTLGNLDRPCLLIEEGRPTLACFAASTYHFGQNRPDNETWILTVPITA